MLTPGTLPKTHPRELPLSQGMPGPCCSLHPTHPAQERANKGQPQIFPAKRGTCSLHTAQLQPSSPKFSSGTQFKHPCPAQAAGSPGGCEETAGGSQEHPPSSRCPRLLWPGLMGIAAASPGPADDFLLPSFTMEASINMGKTRGPWRRRGAKAPQHALLPPQHSDFASDTAMSPRLFFVPLQ